MGLRWPQVVLEVIPWFGGVNNTTVFSRKAHYEKLMKVTFRKEIWRLFLSIFSEKFEIMLSTADWLKNKNAQKYFLTPEMEPHDLIRLEN
jgi:hypothetical protein